MHGKLTTVEGLLRDIASDLGVAQPLRRIQDEVAYTRIQEIIEGIKEVLDDLDEDEDEGGDEMAKTVDKAKNKDDPVKRMITIKFDDPSGRSFVEFLENVSDPKWTFKTYARNIAQNRALGLLPPEEPLDESNGISKEMKEPEGEGAEGPNEEIYEFPGICSRCGCPLVTRMKKVSIPYFKVCPTYDYPQARC